MCVMLMAALACRARATVRVSQTDGRWDAIEWLPEGRPVAGDTVIISSFSSVADMPSLQLGMLKIREGATLAIDEGEPVVAGLLNQGTIMIERPGALSVAGSVTNIGTIAGDGVLRMAMSGGAIEGSGSFTNLLISAGPSGAVMLGSSITVPSLSVAPGNRLLIGSSTITVNGPYNAGSASGPPGIIAASGTIVLNGSVYGSARGAVTIGVNPNARPSKRAAPTLITGVLGDTGRPLRISATRRLSYSTLIGDVVIDSGAALMTDGIGASGTNLLVGTLTNRGTLSAGDEGYRWTIDGDLINHGTIENCTLVMRGHRALLRSDSGYWDPGISLEYRGIAGDTLRVLGPLIVAKLTIGGTSSTDSNVVVAAGRSYLRVRHDFTSDSTHGCRLVSDTVVSLWGASHGIIAADVLFEGFWGSPIGGAYGAPGRSVTVATRKMIDRGTTIAGRLGTRASAMLTVGAPLVLRGGATIEGEVTMGGSGRITADSSLTLGRSVYGGGTIRLIGAAPGLTVRGPLLDSIRMEIGRDTSASQVTLTGVLRVPRLLIHSGSSIYYHGADSVAVADTFRYDISYLNDFNMVSPAVRPFDPLGTHVFPGASSTLFRFRGGYLRADTVQAGEGYFVSFPTPVVIAQRGGFINLPLTIPVRAGWNLIGAASIAAPASSATANGTVLLSSFVTSIGGSQAVTRLLPGRSYWVNVAIDGSITLNREP
jgi:hypothetical protein